MFVERWSNVCRKFVDRLSNVWRPFVERWSNACRTFVERLSNVCRTFVKRWSNVCRTIGDRLANFCRTFGERLSNVGRKLVERLSNVIETFAVFCGRPTGIAGLCHCQLRSRTAVWSVVDPTPRLMQAHLQAARALPPAAQLLQIRVADVRALRPVARSRANEEGLGQFGCEQRRKHNYRLIAWGGRRVAPRHGPGPFSKSINDVHFILLGDVALGLLEKRFNSDVISFELQLHSVPKRNYRRFVVDLQKLPRTMPNQILMHSTAFVAAPPSSTLALPLNHNSLRGSGQTILENQG